MKSTFAASLLVVGALAQAVAAGTCGGKVCGEDTPCCIQGYCNSVGRYCLPDFCEAANSRDANSCWPVAHCVDISNNFDTPSEVAAGGKYAGDAYATNWMSDFDYPRDNARVANSNLQLDMTFDKNFMEGRGFGAAVGATRQIEYGTASARIKAGNVAKGVVASFIIRNDRRGDEIDFEWVGLEPDNVQTNYYFNNELDWTKMIRSPVTPGMSTSYHDYALKWTPDQIDWMLNGKVIRTLTRASTWDPVTKTYKYPSVESRVSFSIWDGGAGGEELKGTKDWAGTPTPWGPGTVYTMLIDSAKIECYYKGNATTYAVPHNAQRSTEVSMSLSADESSSDDADTDDADDMSSASGTHSASNSAEHHSSSESEAASPSEAASESGDDASAGETVTDDSGSAVAGLSSFAASFAAAAAVVVAAAAL